MPTALAKLSTLKARIGSTETGSDPMLTELLANATAIAEQPKQAGRPLRREAGRIEYPAPGSFGLRRLRLDLAPIESIASVKVLYAPGNDDDFEAAAALTEGTDYAVEKETGYLIGLTLCWPCVYRGIQVVYTGGYVDPSIEDPPEDSIQPPEDLQEGIVMEAWAQFSRCNVGNIDNASGGNPGGGTVNLGSYKPHPMLAAACEALRRLTI